MLDTEERTTVKSGTVEMLLISVVTGYRMAFNDLMQMLEGEKFNISMQQ
jgi:hypothetical protein